MGRQNGKSVLGAIFGVYGLYFHEYSPRVVSLGFSAKTAEVIYDRVAYAVNNQPKFKKVTKVTKVSGIRRTDAPGEYIIKPASEKSIQGFPITMCLYDEVHITPQALWSAAKQGTKTKKDGFILGITTAGDENSELLKSLYEQGTEAIANPDDEDKQRFGFFLWTAPEGASIDDDEAIAAANPAVAAGRISARTVRTDALTDPEPLQKRYVLNQFVAATNSWLPMSLYYRAEGSHIPTGSRLTLSVEVSASMGYGTITAAWKDPQGVVHTEMVESFVNPTQEVLLQACKGLHSKFPINTFVVDGLYLRTLGAGLKASGMPVKVLNAGQAQAAAGIVYSLFVQKRIKHDNQPLLTNQMPRAVIKSIGDSWAISRAKSSVEIDAVMSLVNAAYVAETTPDHGIQLF